MVLVDVRLLGERQPRIGEERTLDVARYRPRRTRRDHCISARRDLSFHPWGPRAHADFLDPGRLCDHLGTAKPVSRPRSAVRSLPFRRARWLNRCSRTMQIMAALIHGFTFFSFR